MFKLLNNQSFENSMYLIAGGEDTHDFGSCQSKRILEKIKSKEKIFKDEDTIFFLTHNSTTGELEPYFKIEYTNLLCYIYLNKYDKIKKY